MDLENIICKICEIQTDKYMTLHVESKSNTNKCTAVKTRRYRNQISGYQRGKVSRRGAN